MPDLTALTQSHLEAARTSDHGRSAELLVRDGVLRQSILALVAGSELGEHNSPHAASLQVLLGRVRVTGPDTSELTTGGLHVLTHERHAVSALEDSVFLLTTVTGLPGETSHA
ncbi:cupin [Georgenia sp. MJ206]|uniref:cupin n=1 Tax=Georgenia wangjunii TaxID=3117730 RepID=UPI002F267D75